MIKQQIRIAVRRANLEIDSSARQEIAQNIFSQIESSATFATSHTIALYSALPDEIPTEQTIERWSRMGKCILLPRVESDTTMEFYPYTTPSKLSQGEFGIMEPTSETTPFEPYKIDLMILPAVALSRDGRRLGRGRGYYDRYLAREGFSAHTIGVAYPHQILEQIPCEAHDIALNEVLSGEEQVLERNKISLPAIILSVIEAAGVDATRLGCGITRLNQMGISWVLLQLAIELYKTPSAEEKIEIETWINDCNRVTSTRNFTLKNRRGEVIGMASTQWCLIDLNTRRAVNLITSEINYAQYVNAQPSSISIERRLPSFLPESPTTEAQHLATERDIDFNNHVNTIRYIEMMLSQLPLNLQTRVAPTRCDIHFASESRLGDLLTIKRQERPHPNGKQSLFEIARHDGTTSVKALFTHLD